MIDKVLGQRVTYPRTYEPTILVAVPRQLNRDSLGLSNDNLPFVGADAWHAYEVSCLTNNGLPVVGLMKIVYPCTSPSIVESKSLKLYLNSFNMEKMGNTANDALGNMAHRVRTDLSKLLECEVHVATFDCDTTHGEPLFGNTHFATLESNADAQNISIEQYTETPNVLTHSDSHGRMTVKSNLLRSNCRVTHQPDWGTVFIDIEGDHLPNKNGLLEYIVSLRGENHFHEEICELIYVRLAEIFKPQKLMVCCVYTRRGGIDICPVRASHAALMPTKLTSANSLTHKLLRQ